MTAITPTFLVLGELRREYLITADDQVFVDQPGGNALYAAGGLALWLEPEQRLGLVARVGEDYPQRWLTRFEGAGYNTEGIRMLTQSIDLRQLIAYTSLRERSYDEPVKHFARLGISLPKSLLGYRAQPQTIDSLSAPRELTLRQGDIPESLRYARAAHLAPHDFITHSLMPAALRQVGVGAITVDPSPRYMQPELFHAVPQLLPGLTAFMPSEEEALNLFRGRSTDLWEIAEALGAYGCEFIVITLGEGGQLLYVAATGERYEVPAYPSHPVDITGAGDAFAGGLLAGFQRTFEPLQAVMHGNIAASITVEGSGAFFWQDTLPGLGRARLETLAGMVTRA